MGKKIIYEITESAVNKILNDLGYNEQTVDQMRDLGEVAKLAGSKLTPEKYFNRILNKVFKLMKEQNRKHQAILDKETG